MLSIKESKDSIPVAYIPEKDRFIYYEDRETPDEENLEQLLEITADVLFDDNKRKQISAKDTLILESAIENKKEPKEPRLKRIYEMAINVIAERAGKEYHTDESVFPCPFINPKEKQVEVTFVAGPKGSGKSTYCSRYCTMWLYFFPDRPIYLFSRKTEDEVLDNIDTLKRIVIDQSFIEKPMEIEEIKDHDKPVLVIFDDVDAITDKKLLKAISSLKTQLMEIGRSSNIWMLITAHQLMNYKATRDTINSSDTIVFFPGNTKYHIKRFLQTYQGFDKVMVDRVMKLKTRWVALKRSSPAYIVYEHGAYLV